MLQERISELEDRMLEIIQPEQRGKRLKKKHEQSLGNPWVNNTNSKNQINGIQGEQEECCIEKLMTENTPSFREKP